MIYFISDAHFGHRNIHKMGGRPVSSPEENEAWITDCWLSMVSRKTAWDRQDIVYCLGDMAFDEEALRRIHNLPGRKVLIAGNHDWMREPAWRDVYERVGGIEKYKGMWLTHCPVHPDELRGKPNIHGHVHNATIDDPRYFNICPENLYRLVGRPMISLDDLRRLRNPIPNPVLP